MVGILFAALLGSFIAAFTVMLLSAILGRVYEGYSASKYREYLWVHVLVGAVIGAALAILVS